MSVVEHRIEGAMQLHSPNQDERPFGEISLIVVHGISLPAGKFGGQEVCELFTNCLDVSGPELSDLEGIKVSSHLFIRRTGELIQFVPFNRRAWHAGASSFAGREHCNDYSIGIELEGTDTTAYEEAQYEVLSNVCASLMKSYSVTEITSHSAISPDRKTDPGPAFNWGILRRKLARKS
jgi:N-acetyl-anhydromuramoyl-L-alanine amidase|tara:strand:+ start:685 stop:1221 length:537 start_codon:yes stop_codon:yes gene_type:complete